MIEPKALRTGHEYRLTTGDVVLVEAITGKGCGKTVRINREPAGHPGCRHFKIKRFAALAEADLGRPGTGTFEMELSCDSIKIRRKS